MWRTTMIAAGMAVALGGAAADLSAQGRAQGRATEGYERRDERDRKGSVARGTSGRATGRATTTRENRPEVLQGDRRGTSGPVFGRGVDGRDRDRDSDSDRYDRRRDDRHDRYDRYEVNRKNAPPFCRSGRGHPVHGREWCRQKGYGLGDDRWERARWDDVIFGRRNTSGRVSGSILEQIVGRTVYGRLAQQSRQLGGGSMYGQWVTPSGGPRMLHVYSGSRPLAEFVDANRDGRAELVLLNLGR